MKHHAFRMAGVDTPIIPTIAALVRNNPGTISLGQGVVNYGPPPQAIAALPSMMGDGSLHFDTRKLVLFLAIEKYIKLDNVIG